MSRDGWNRCRIGDIFTVARGGSPRPIDAYLTDDPEGINWIKIGDATASGKFIRTTKERIKPEGLSKTRKVIPGDFILSNSMSFGRPYIMAIDGCIHDGWLLLRPNDENSIDREFYYYLLGSDILQQLFSAQAAGSAVRNLNIDLVAAVEVQVPPLHEQRRIAEILSSVDEAIAATRAVIEQTRKVKQGVLERLLTKGIGHTRFKQTEIGEIPEGWETGKIGDFFTLQRGFDITEKQSTAGEYPVVSSSGISYFHSEAMIHGPAVITGRKGKLGQVHFIDSSCWPHDTTLWVKDFKGNAPKFVYWFLRSLNLEKFDAATAVPTLNRNVVHALRCAFPPVSEQLLISDHLDSIEATEGAQTRNLTAYGPMKSALMSDLLTGRKRVTDAVPMAAE